MDYLGAFIEDIRRRAPVGAIIEVENDKEITLSFNGWGDDHMSLLLYDISNDHCHLTSEDWNLVNIDLERFYGPDTTPLERANILNGVIEYINWHNPLFQGILNMEDIQHDLQEEHDNPQNEL